MCNISKFHFLFVNKLFSRISVYIWIIFLFFGCKKAGSAVSRAAGFG